MSRGDAVSKVGRIRAGGQARGRPDAQAGGQAGGPGEEAGTSAQDGDGNRDVVRGEGKDREGVEQFMETEV